ncbi:serine/threonine-protein phosphatase pp2a 65 kda regulatory subunit [Holotrichia oblita]|uniref:Serine/threonine-protein phosphatase pp2a 65 kDa regulatory subunit n=1 Tax=Holotrichia oblita TaxID=644536 RepID=A0ACB9T5S3_HOLOL|nr:serine/threonine-protein phosphatase pp2a 65 kda regulatory subunit [Holotrichia oblita]
MTNECTDPIDLFRTEAYHDDIQIQLRAVKKLPTLAVALDVDRTRHELIPTLEDFLDVIYFNNDEVLLVLAEQLGKFVPFIGGVDYAFLLLPMLEKLAATDDTCTREKAVESLQHVASLMSGNQLEEHFLKIIQTMSEAEWFTSKCSAAGLISICYPKLSDEGKRNIRQLFLSLLENESPMVKREAAKYFADIIKVVEVQYLKEEFIPSFKKLSTDDQDSVRLLAVNVAVALASRLSPAEIEEHILDTLNSLCADFSWRVRYQFANEINSIQTAVGPSITRKSIVPLYQILVRDTEANIREISARNIVQFCEILQKSYLETTNAKKDDLDPVIKDEILPLIKELDKDVVEDVQDGLYSVIISLSSLLGETNTKDFLLPLITSSIENDSSKVKESIVTNLNNIICVIGIEELSGTVQKLMTDLVKTSIWRTRRNLIVTLCHIARHSKKDYFDQHLKSLYVDLLNDRIYGVRKVATLILPVIKNLNEVLAVQLEEEWVGIVLAFIEDEDYFNEDIKVYAEETLDAFTKCGDLVVGSITNNEISKRDIEETYLEGLLFLILAYFLDKIHILAQDPVVNIRMRAASTLQKIYNFNNALRKELEEPWVTKLINITSVNDRMTLMQECRNELLEAVNLKNKLTDVNKQELPPVPAIPAIDDVKIEDVTANSPTPMEVDPPQVSEIPGSEIIEKVEEKMEEVGSPPESAVQEQEAKVEVVEKLEPPPMESGEIAKAVEETQETLNVAKSEPVIEAVTSEQVVQANPDEKVSEKTEDAKMDVQNV